MPAHHARKKCCCPEVGQTARYLEVESVISIPQCAYMLDDVTFFVDLGDDVEISPDLVLYEGGSASTANIPVLLDYVDVFVPDDIRGIFWPDGEITGAGNLGDIGALRHRGWKIKSSGLQLTRAQMVQGDGVEGTRIIMDLPGSATDDPVFQVEEGGYHFLAGEFSQTPALISEPTETVDENGNPAQYRIGYNPRRECSKPEQGRYYGNDDRPRLLFDFTCTFPATITLEYTYTFRIGGTTYSHDMSRSYSKFVAGGATRQTFETLDTSVGSGTYSNVDGFINEDPNDSALIQFGYRSIDCTDEIVDPSDATKRLYFSVPSMPIRYFTFGDRDQFTSVSGQLTVAQGDPGANMSSVSTDESFSGSTQRFIPHQFRFGAVTSDYTRGPDNIPLANNTFPVMATNSFGVVINSGFSFGEVESGTNTQTSAVSYKGTDELNAIHTFSIENAYFNRLPAISRGFSPIVPASGIDTLQGVIERGYGFGTGDFPAVHLDAKSGTVRLETMRNPLGGGYHYLTDGLSSGSDFPAPNISTAVPMSPPNISKS